MFRFKTVLILIPYPTILVCLHGFVKLL